MKNKDTRYKIQRLLNIGICLYLVSWLLGVPCQAAVVYDPGLTWKTIETAHFSIHYHDGLEKIATDFAPQAELVHRSLAPFLKHTPDIKTNVVLTDNYDIGNGWANVVPYPIVTLYVTDLGSNLSPYSYKNWLKYVFTHEYSHILNLDTVEGGALLSKMIFGRVLFPNSLAPGFLIEGLAVYLETEFSPGGRIKNPRFEAMIRMDVLEKNMKSIDQAAVSTVLWPGRNLYYVYGAYFMDYLASTYGRDKITKLNLLYGEYVLSEGIDRGFAAVFGKGLNELWSDWIKALEKKYEKEKIEKGKISSSSPLTAGGFYNLQPAWSGDSQTVYYTQSNAGDYPCIRAVNISDKSSRAVLENSAFDDNLSQKNGRLVFSKGQTSRNFYYYKDLYMLDLNSKKEARLSNGQRMSDPGLSYDGKNIVFTQIEKGARKLRLMEVESRKIIPLGSPAAGESYFSPVFSPDGKSIASAKWVKGDQSIYILDLESGEEEKIGSLGQCGNPAYTQDGSYILFDSDFSGIANIYAFKVKERELYQVTNVLGMALMPEVSPDMQNICYVNYSSKGYDLAVIPFEPEQWKRVIWKNGNKKTEEEPKDIQLFSSRKTAYNPIPALLPKFWIPLSAADENGSHTSIFTMGQDALSQHAYQVQLSYDWTADRPIYEIVYVNNQLLPQIAVQVLDSAQAYQWDNNSKIYWERYQGQALYASFINQVLFKDYDVQVLSFGIENISLTSISTLSALTAQPSLGGLRGAGAAYRYFSSRTYPASISPEDGIDFSLSAKFFSKDLGGDYFFNRYSFSSGQYFKMPFPHHVLALSQYGSVVKGDSIAQGGYTWNYQNVRGYPSNYFPGSSLGLVNAEYRFPITNIEKGLSYGYTFFDRVWGAVFVESGGATFSSFRNIVWKNSVGGEVTLNTISGFGYAPINFTLGFAQGLDQGGEKKIYFGISGSGMGMLVGVQNADESLLMQ